MEFLADTGKVLDAIAKVRKLLIELNPDRAVVLTVDHGPHVRNGIGEPTEHRTGCRRRGALAKVFVDDLDCALCPAERSGMVSRSVLSRGDFAFSSTCLVVRCSFPRFEISA